MVALKPSEPFSEGLNTEAHLVIKIYHRPCSVSVAIIFFLPHLERSVSALLIPLGEIYQGSHSHAGSVPLSCPLSGDAP